LFAVKDEDGIWAAISVATKQVSNDESEIVVGFGFDVQKLAEVIY
jgi:hypothetical protein